MNLSSINLLSDAKYFDESSTKVAELRIMLDSRHMKEKLEAMKKLLALMTLGRDMSAFFPDVVKNVIVDSQEVKKLVYMFLISYAETNQDLALLSINTFQKDLASPSQRIRANAMKAMSSIRIPVAVPLVLLALKSAIKDNSSYVRRAAACAIPKVFYIDGEEQMDQLKEMISELLSNTEPIVLGAALYAFNEVCPDDWELIHPHYRKICHLLADFDEWGQILALYVLLRYGRTQFLSPFDVKEIQVDGTPVVKENGKSKPKKEKAFYSDEEESSEDDEENSKTKKEKDSDEDEEEDKEKEVDEDHMLLLKQSSQLLLSANTGVIIAVATLYWHLAPPHQCAILAKPLTRISRNRRSLQFVILGIISTMAQQRPSLFHPYIKDYFIYSTDARYVKAIKLDILTNISTDLTVQMLLREFAAYMRDPDKEFVCSVIHALGRVALKMPSIAERCMKILMSNVTSIHENIVAQSVIVIRQLLQNNSSLHGTVVKRMALLLDRVTNAMARAAIVWMIGEYREKIATMAPDCLRKLAKTFKDEDTIVKQQILNVSVKLFLSNPKQTASIFKYIMDLCKYDMNYDLRDRARLMRSLFFKKKTEANGESVLDKPTKETPSEVKEYLKNVFLSTKPAPAMLPPFAGRDRFTLGSLSHSLNMATTSYVPLPEFPLVAPDPDVRKPVVPEYELEAARRARGSGSESNSSSGSESESDFSSFDSDASDRSDRSSRSSSVSRSDSESDRSSEFESESDGHRARSTRRRRSRSISSSADSDDSRSESESSNSSRASSSEESSESESSEDDRRARNKRNAKKASSPVVTPKHEKVHEIRPEKGKSRRTSSKTADLLDLQGLEDALPEKTATSLPSPSTTTLSAPLDELVRSSSSNSARALQGVTPPKNGQRGLLLNPISGGGLQIDYIFTRRVSLYDKRMIAIDLFFLNTSPVPLDEISMEEDNDDENLSRGFEEVGKGVTLEPGSRVDYKVHVNFKGKPMPREWSVVIKGQKYPVKVTPSVGELVRPLLLTWQEFDDKAKKLSGMNEHKLKVETSLELSSLPQRVVDSSNVSALTPPSLKDDDSEEEPTITYRFVGQALYDDSIVLIQLSSVKKSGNVEISVNHSEFLFASTFVDLIKKTILS